MQGQRLYIIINHSITTVNIVASKLGLQHIGSIVSQQLCFVCLRKFPSFCVCKNFAYFILFFDQEFVLKYIGLSLYLHLLRCLITNNILFPGLRLCTLLVQKVGHTKIKCFHQDQINISLYWKLMVTLLLSWASHVIELPGRRVDYVHMLGY